MEDDFYTLVERSGAHQQWKIVSVIIRNDEMRNETYFFCDISLTRDFPHSLLGVPEDLLCGMNALSNQFV